MTRKVAVAAVVAFGALLAAAALVLFPFGARDRSAAKLSLFEPHAGGCLWSRFDIDRDRTKEVARFPADCLGVQVAWSPVDEGALVWFAPDGVAPQEVMLYRVDTRTGKVTQLPLPEIGDPESYVLDRGGRILAFTTDTSGADALARALRLSDDGHWDVVETTSPGCCEGETLGIAQLKTWVDVVQDPTLAERRSETLLTAAPAGHQIKNPALPGDSWRLLRRPAWDIALAFKSREGDSVRATGETRFFFGKVAKALPDLALSPTDVVQIMESGALVLMTEWATGTNPHLYEMHTGRLLYTSKVATAVVFWPDPPSPARPG